MVLRQLFRIFVLGMVLAMVIAACGQAAAPAATAPVPTPSSVPAPASPTPAVAATAPSGGAPLPAISGYPPERVREMLAQNMYLATMQYGEGETPQYGGTAFYPNKADPATDDPMTSGSITMNNVFNAVIGDAGLVRGKRTQNDQIVGHLAESWTLSDDTRVWTFKLRPGISWHDGTPLVAEDIKWYIETAVNPPKGRKLGGFFNTLPGLLEVHVIDPLTLRLSFKDPSPHLLEGISATGGIIAHQRKRGQAEIDKGNVTFGMVALGGVGLGPFKWDGYTKGSSFRSIRNDQYWEKDDQGRAIPYLDSIQNVMITDKIVTLSAFRAGRLDTMSRGIGASPDADMIKLINKSLGKENVWYHRFPYLAQGLTMNLAKPPFDDIRVRKAINLYLDREEACQKLYGGFCFGTGFTVPGVYWYSGAYVSWPGFDPAKKAQDQAEAKRLIREAGVAGMNVEQSCRIDYTFIAEFNEQLLRSLGFEPRINCMDIQLHNEYQAGGKWHSATGGPASGGFPGPVLLSWTSYAKVNVTSHNDPKFDEWQRIILTSLDPVERRTALFEAERYQLVDHIFMAPLLREEVVMPQRTYLKGTIVPGWQASDNTDRSTDWIDKTLRDKVAK